MTIEKSRIQIKLPDKVRHIIETLNDAGFEAYAVGGCVRDSVLGRIPKDWDITTSAHPLDVKKLFRRTVDTGIQHGTVTVMMGDEGYEVTTYRIDCEYEDMRHPREVIFTDMLTEDLRRRDFTINAMAYSDRTGLIDEFDGLSCIESRTIKAVGNAHDRLSEDALRILRALRFSAELSYDMDAELEDAIRELAPNLKMISAERIATELIKLITSDNPDKIKELYRLGVSAVILPELDVCFETEQNTPHHCYTVGDHTVKALTEVRKLTGDLTERENKIIMLAVLFHDFGKPHAKTTDEITGRDHFFNHPDISEQMAADIMHRLKLDNDTILNVKKLVKWHDFRPKLTMPKVRRLMVAVGADRMEMLLKLRRADTFAQSEYERAEKLEYIEELTLKYNKIISDGDCLSIKELSVTGNDLITLGIKPGPQIGDILNKLLELVLDNPHKNNRDYLITQAEEMMRQQPGSSNKL